jgi:pimeloyl-ACP methyl ester carboxylesterase
MPALARPETRYARAGDLSIAYQQFGEGELAIVISAGWLFTIDIAWDHPKIVEGWEHLGSIARVVMFDRRGTGLSDAVERAPTLEERMEDLQAVMDAAGVERAVLYGSSEGAPLSILFAATHPERVRALVLYGAMARTTPTADYPYGNDVDALLESGSEFVTPYWGQGVSAEIAAPSVADDPEIRAHFARMERGSTKPAFLRQSWLAFIDTDVTDILGSIHVPTLVIHRTHDRLVDVRAGRWLAERIPDAKFVELPGSDHNYWFDAADLVSGEIEEFLLGRRREREPDRALLTVLFTDIVGSTEKAAEVGDGRWRELLDDHQRAARAAFARHRGREIKAMGDGFLAAFDGPARAIRCAEQIVSEAEAADLQGRAGIHTGECELLGDDIGGIAVHVGQRVASLAGPGEVLTSSTVKDLVAGSNIEFEDRGERELKGLSETRRLYAVSRDAAS